MARILIKHVKGSKANQTDAFELPITELTFGRDPGSNIRFDPERDDVVGRSHARLAASPDSPQSFILTDLNSRNGTYINGTRVHGSAPVTPEDVVKLGEAGPEFIFDLDPRPERLPKPTRIAEAASPPTRESRIPSGSVPSVTATATPSPVSGSISRNTVERLILETRTDTRKKIINIASTVVALVVLVAGFLLYQSKQSNKELVNALGQQNQTTSSEIKKLVAKNEEIETKLDDVKPKSIPASQIADEFSQSTVFIEASWKLIHIPTGRQLYHKVDCYQRKKGGYCADRSLPWYIMFEDAVEPWLADDQGPDDRNIPIGNSGQGSGFVVTEGGFMLTNRHVAAGWETSYSGLPLPGYLLVCPDPDCSKPTVKLLDRKNDSDSKYIASLNTWVPSKTKTLGGKPMKGKRLEGRNDYLDVTFPNTRIRIPAQVVRVSDIADVALIKIELPQILKPVQLGGEDPVQPGDNVTVTGYPAVSPDIAVKLSSQDPMNRSGEWRVIPNPTVSTSTIAKIINGQAKVLGNTTSEYFSEMGDVYQLNLNTTGHGNSGGPVFNDQGRVIGLFTYGKTDQSGTQISFAVPIKYGQEIMGVNTIIK